MFDIIKSYFDKEEYYIILLNDRLLIKNFKKIYELTDYGLIIEIGSNTYRISGNSISLVKNYHKDLELVGNFEAIEKV